MIAVSRCCCLTVVLGLGLCLPAFAVDLSPAASVAPLGEWSQDCNSGFLLSAMPSAWSMAPGQGLTVMTRVAIDFEALPEDVYVVSRDDRSGERVYDLTGFEYMALEAEIRRLGTGRVIRVLPGTYSMDHAKAPVVFVWDGRNKEGIVAGPGLYEIEVRGRFVPRWAGLIAEDGYGYRDLESWSVVEEACRRTLTVEITRKTIHRDKAGRGTSCAAPPASYYSTVDATSSATLRSTLHPVIDDHTRFPYSSTSTDTWDVLNDADENPSNASQLLTVYKNEANADGCSSGCAWNREHVWAKSFGFSEESGNGRIPYTDCHHLHAADPGYNSSRGNKVLNDCPGCTTYSTDANNGFGGGAGDVNRGSGGSTSCGNTPTAGDVWETWDHRKGDIARTILYMDIRYEGDTGAMGAEQDLVATSDLALMRVETTSCGDGYQDPAYHGVLSTLLAWHAADPVDSDEQRRNDQVWCYQGNRNPFVDHPEWVDCLYNNVCSGSTNPVFGGIDSATDPDGCLATGVDISWSTPTDWNDGCSSSCSRGFRVYRGGVQISSGGCAGVLGEAVTSCTDTAGSAGTTYTYTVEADNDLGSTSSGGTSEDAADSADDGSAPVISSGPTASSTSSTLTASWTTNEISDSYLEWGTAAGGPYPDTTSDGTDVTSHSLTATGLASSTTYYYRVCSTDPCGHGPTCSAENTATTAGGCDPGSNTPIFINEFHYDNVGTDSGEFVEVAGPAGTDLTSWQIGLYNGSGGAQYDLDALGAVIDDEGNGYGAISISYPSNGLQNGAPDGLALIDASGSVVQFLCYEGTFTATSGAANGLTCTNVGVSEDASPMGDTLQLIGGPGFVYEDFSWTGPTAGSPGSLNAGQDMRCGSGPTAPAFGGIDAATDVDPCAVTGIRIDWTTPSAWNDGCSSGCTRGFNVIRDGVALASGGCGGAQAEASVSCVDTTAAAGTSYTYKVEAFGDTGLTSDGGGASIAETEATSDGTAPVITVGPATTVTSSSFTATWTTDEASDSYIYWGTTSGSYPNSTSDASDVTGHSLDVTGLSANTTYYYQVCSTDACGNGPTCSSEATVTTAGGCVPGAGEHPIFINELHYDNSGGDTGEFVEIAGPAGTDLGNGPWTIVLYNGSNGEVYDTVNLSGTIDNEGTGYGALSFATASIQNGAPDGLALVDDSGSVVQFLSYEGTFTASNGPAVGLTSVDIGVDETPAPAAGYSLQLTGGPGIVYEDFSWSGPAVDSPGSLNSGQTMECSAPPNQIQDLTATSTSGQVVLEWLDPSSYPAGGVTRLCRDTGTYPTDPTTCTIAGTVTDVAGSADGYGSLTDSASLANGTRYFYSAWVLDSGGTASAKKSVSALPFDTTGSAKWSYHSSASSLAPPGLYPGAVGTGAIYAVANDNTLHAMDPSNAGGHWPRTAPFNWRPMPMNGPAAQRPPVVPTTVDTSDLVVFLGSEDGHAYAVDAHSGATLWQSSQLATMITASVAGRFSTFGGIYDLLFVGSRDAGAANALFGLNPATGATLWTFDNGGTAIGIISSGVTVDYANDLLYFTSREHTTGSTSTLWCLSFTNGGASVEWERALGDIDGAPVLFGGRVYVGTNSGEVHALDAATGASLWPSPFSTGDGPIKGFVTPGSTGLPRRLVFATTNDVWALTDGGSSVALEWNQGGVSGPSIPLVLEGTGIYVGSIDGNLHQLDETTGAVGSSLVLGDGSAAIGSPSYDFINAMLSVGSENGALYAVTLPLP